MQNLISKACRAGTTYILPAKKPGIVYKLDVLENPSVANVYPSAQDIIHPALLWQYPGATTSTASCELRELLARQWSAHIILTCGSDGALKLIFDTYAHPDAVMIASAPTYPHALHFMTNACAVPPKMVNYETDIAAQLRAELAKYARGGVCYIANPNLPLGYLCPKDALESLARDFPQFIFVIDEAYIEFAGPKFSTPAPITPQNMIIVRTFSKFYGLAGLRIGYLATPSQEVAQHLSVLHNMKDVSEIAASYALWALNHPMEFALALCSFNAEHDYLMDALTHCTMPTAPIYGFSLGYGNFYSIFCRDPARVEEQFARFGIQIRNKNAEVAHACRICIQERAANEAVIRAICAINLSYLVARARSVIIDLDGTLRARCGEQISEAGLALLKKLGPRAIVMTNNVSADAFRALAQCGQAQIITPIDHLATDIKALSLLYSRDKEEYCYVIATPDMRARILERVPSAIFEQDDARFAQCHMCAILNVPWPNLRDYEAIARVVARSRELGLIARICIADASTRCDFARECSDEYALSAGESGALMIPDMGSLIPLLRATYGELAEVRMIGKPLCYRAPCDFIIGDSSADLEQNILSAETFGANLPIHHILVDPRARDAIAIRGAPVRVHFAIASLIELLRE